MYSFQVRPVDAVDAASGGRWDVLLVAGFVETIVGTAIASSRVVRVSHVACVGDATENVWRWPLYLAQALVLAHHLQQLLVLILGQDHSLTLAP